MKVERRTIYIAKDGEEFSSRKECEKYEADGCVNLKPLPDYGDRVPLTEQNLRWMLNGDGSCYYATATQISDIQAGSSPHPKWATHLMYFGK